MVRFFALAHLHGRVRGGGHLQGDHSFSVVVDLAAKDGIAGLGIAITGKYAAEPEWTA